jgi:tetratricopeptide (TPR) repeat protein
MTRLTRLAVPAALACLLVACLIAAGVAGAEDFEVVQLSPRAIIVKEPALGRQVAVATEKGIVVFDTFRGEPTAAKFKREIAKALGRDDFAYVINMIDRLDLIGGNAAYPEALILSQENLLKKYEGNEEAVKAEVQDLIEMWRWKEEARNEQAWINTCRQRAEELESGFSLVLPDSVYKDRITLDLGDVTLKLIWFGREGSYDAITVAVIPEERIALTNTCVMSWLHLAPYPYGRYADLDVPRWIAVLEEVLEGDDAVDQIVPSDNGEPLPRDRALEHLEYMRRLWDSVEADEAAGMTLDEIEDHLSLDRDFAFVKDMAVYRETGDDWLRPQHRDHVKVFYLQHKDYVASNIIMAGGIEGLEASLAGVRELRDKGSDIYIDEGDINGIGYNLMNAGKVPEAIQVFTLNVDLFPVSSNVYDSLGEAYMKHGDKQEAIANYRKSLDLNPGNTNAVQMLQDLEKMQ